MNLGLFLSIIFCFLQKDFKKVFYLVFFVGLINDFVNGGLVGVSSLFFLVITFLIYLYQRKFSPYHLLFQLPFVLLSDYFYKMITFKQWSFKNFLLLVGLTLIIFSLLNRMKARHLGLELDI